MASHLITTSIHLDEWNFNKKIALKCSWTSYGFNTLRSGQNGRHFADDIFKCIFVNENVWIPIKISLKFVPKGPINNIPGIVQIIAWRRPANKPLSEPMIVRLLTHTCVTRPQWVKRWNSHEYYVYVRTTWVELFPDTKCITSVPSKWGIAHCYVWSSFIDLKDNNDILFQFTLIYVVC